MPGGCSWTKNWLTFDNSYYRNAFAGTDKAAYMSTLVDEDGERDGESQENHLFSAISNPMRMTTNPKARTPVNLNHLLRLRDPELLWLPTDNALETDPELKSFFFMYAKSQQVWFHDYAAAHKKMSTIDRLEWQSPGPLAGSFGSPARTRETCCLVRFAIWM